MKKLGLAALTACALMVAGNASAAVNLIENGGFDLDSPPAATNPLDWASVKGIAALVIGDEPGVGVVSGPNAANFGSSTGTYLGQSVTLVPGRTYILSFELTESGADPANFFNAAIDQTPGDIQLLHLDNPSPFGYTLYTYTFVATSAAGAVVFEGTDHNGWFALDDVSLVAAPEPATWALMLAGVVGLGVAIRSRRAWSTLAQAPHGGWGGGQ